MRTTTPAPTGTVRDLGADLSAPLCRSQLGEATFFDATRPWEPVEPPPRLGLIDGFAARSAETLVGRRQLQRDLERALRSCGRGYFIDHAAVGDRWTSLGMLAVLEASVSMPWSFADSISE